MSDFTTMRRWSSWWDAHALTRRIVVSVVVVVIGAAAMHYAGVGT
jgi:hypothetical protein